MGVDRIWFSLCNLCVLRASVVAKLEKQSPQRHREHEGNTEKIRLGGDENESVRGALRPGVAIGAKCFGSPSWLRKEPNVIPPRRVKKNAL